MKKKLINLGVGLLIAWLFGWLVWPTPYIHSSMKIGPNELPVRIHRITGKAEMLTPAGWIALPSK